tara:strand:+ start:19 stop:1116 length:1098 start_codon:yes stop_codon:yes gene_type:complete
MAINFNNQNRGIGTLDLSEYGLLQPQNQNMQVATGYDTPTEGQYGFNLIELDRLKNAGYDPAEVSGYENKEDVQSLIRSLEPTSMAISNYDQLFGPRTMSDANQSLYTGMMDQSGTPIDYTDRIRQQNLPEFANQPQYRIRDQLKRDFLEGGLFKDAKQSLGQTKDAFLEDVSGLRNMIGSGLGSLKDFAIDKGRMGRNLLGSAGAMALGLPGIVGSGAMTLLSGLGNMFEDRQLSGDGTTVDEYGRSYNASDLNKQNALGGYYTEAARSSRRRTNRINDMLARKAKGKRISAANLARLQAQEAAQEAARQAATTRMAQQNRQSGSGGYQSSFGGDSGFMGGSGTAAEMGSFRDGGLASMFTRRG